MRINEIVVESTLNEGPFGAIGRGVGNVIGGVATGIGAVKGAVKGAVDRVKKDFAAGQKGAYDAVAGKPAAATATPPAAKPASQTQTLANPKSPPDAGAATPPAGAATPPTAAGGTTSTGGAGGTTPPTGDAAGGSATPAATGGSTTPPAGGAAEPAAKKPGILGKIGQAVKDFKKGYAGDDDAGIDAQKPAAGGQDGGQLPVAGAAGAAAGAAGAAPAAEKPADASGAGGAATPPDAAPPEPPAAAPVADPAYDKTQKAVEALPPEQKKEIIGLLQADAEVKAAMAEPVPAKDTTGAPQSAAAQKPAYTPPTDPETIADMQKRGYDPATGNKPTAAADRFGKAIVEPLQKLQQNASRVNSGTALSEALARRVAQHKQQMFETQLINGTQSIFRSRKTTAIDLKNTRK